MSFITLTIEEFVQRDFAERSPKDFEIIKKYFDGKTTVEIPIIPIALNAQFGGFGLSEKAQALIDSKMQKASEDSEDSEGSKALKNAKAYDFYDPYNPYSYKNRTDPVLIETIREIGFKEASGFCCSLYFASLPTKYSEYINITEYDGSESIEFDMNKAVQNLVIDDTLSFDELRSQLTELAFISLVFHRLTNHYATQNSILR